MANRGYLSTPHRLLPGYSSLAASRAGVGVGANSRSSPPEFSYDAFPRAASGRDGARDSSAYSRAPTSPGNSAITMAYPSVNEFPYGLSGVQMPTYNFGSELYNYVSNGFPRKSRMCTFCNKVFTRSTTRRYHERRCPLLRASNSLAKNEENNSAAAAAAALKEQQRQKEAASAIPNPPPSAPRALNTSVSNTTSSQAGANLPTAPTPASPPPSSLHPAYPTSFPPTSALGSSPSRSAAAVYNYAHSYGSHFYNSISAAALASLDQNSNTLQSKKESDNASWASSSPSPSSKLRDHASSANSILGNSALSKAFTSDSGVDLTARYCADFSIRSQPSVFPPTSLRIAPPSPPSPEPGETKSDASLTNGRRNSASPRDFTRTTVRDREWSPNREKVDYPDKIPVANISGARMKTSSPPPIWNNKARIERAQEQYMASQSVEDEEEEDDDEEEEDEEEVEEDEEQFNESMNQHNEIEDMAVDKKSDGDLELKSYKKSTSYNPLVCQFCKKSFADTITRQAHEALHSQTKSFGCSICSHAFHCAYSLRIHFLRHHTEGPYRCKQCAKIFDEAMALKSHLITQHSLPKTETCSLKYFSLLENSSDCAARVPKSSTLSDGEQDIKERSNQSQRRSADSLPDVLKHSVQTTKNLRTNEMEEPLPNGSLTNEETEVCKICNKAFAKSFIRFHERAHADQKPYECPICNKRFGYKNNMKSHMKLHQGLKPYQCQICGARFTRGSTLRRHGRRHNISRNSMLDYVLYDHTAGPTRAIGINKNNMAAAAGANSAVAAVNSQYAKHNRLTTTEQQISKSLSYLQHVRPSLPSTTTAIENERYGPTGRRSPPRTSPQSLVSPRGTSNHLTTQSMTSPMVGGLAAVAAANLFAYPAAAAPHLYQFYASTNQLMNYSAYASNQSTASAVQSDALNLSLGKRKSPFEEEELMIKEKLQRCNSNDLDSPIKGCYDRKENVIKIETEEPGEMIKREGPNPFTPNFSSKKEQPLDMPQRDQHDIAYDTKEVLKIATEDFAAQVNICCPSPRVQSSTGSGQQPPGSPVGSSGLDNVQAHASPSGISHHSSPANSANSAPSPSNMSENQLQELLLSFLTSGRMFRCSYCDIYFTEYAMFRLHQKYHQCDIARPFLCSVCGEDCKDKTYFTVHLSEHLGLGSKPGLA